MLPVTPIDRDKVETEARAKTYWGDSREEVTKFLMAKGISADEAAEMASALSVERAATIRGAGMKKMISGIALILVPIVTWILFTAVIHVIFIKTLALTGAVGLYGTYRVMKGSIMFFSPASETGDVSEM